MTSLQTEYQHFLKQAGDLETLALWMTERLAAMHNLCSGLLHAPYPDKMPTPLLQTCRTHTEQLTTVQKEKRVCRPQV